MESAESYEVVPVGRLDFGDDEANVRRVIAVNDHCVVDITVAAGRGAALTALIFVLLYALVGLPRTLPDHLDCCSASALDIWGGACRAGTAFTFEAHDAYLYSAWMRQVAARKNQRRPKAHGSAEDVCLT